LAEINKDYRVVPFPAEREIAIDTGRLRIRRHFIHGFLEIDVTKPHEFIRGHKMKTGESLSFTCPGWYTYTRSLAEKLAFFRDR
jgi:hypothetical protein